MAVAARLQWILSRADDGHQIRVLSGYAAESQRWKFKILIGNDPGVVPPNSRHFGTALLETIYAKASTASNKLVDRGHRHSRGLSEVCIWSAPSSDAAAPEPGLCSAPDASDNTEDDSEHDGNNHDSREPDRGHGDPWLAGADPWTRGPSQGGVSAPQEKRPRWCPAAGWQPAAALQPWPPIPEFPFKFSGAAGQVPGGVPHGEPLSIDAAALWQQSETRILNAIQAVDERLELATAGLVAVANSELCKIGHPCETYDLVDPAGPADIENVYECDFVATFPRPRSPPRGDRHEDLSAQRPAPNVAHSACQTVRIWSARSVASQTGQPPKPRRFRNNKASQTDWQCDRWGRMAVGLRAQHALNVGERVILAFLEQMNAE